jgi:hypothetical protein
MALQNQISLYKPDRALMLITERVHDPAYVNAFTVLEIRLDDKRHSDGIGLPESRIRPTELALQLVAPFRCAEIALQTGLARPLPVGAATHAFELGGSGPEGFTDSAISRCATIQSKWAAGEKS